MKELGAGLAQGIIIHFDTSATAFSGQKKSAAALNEGANKSTH